MEINCALDDDDDDDGVCEWEETERGIKWKKAVVIIFNKARVLTFNRFYLYSTFSWFELSRGLNCGIDGKNL